MRTIVAAAAGLRQIRDAPQLHAKESVGNFGSAVNEAGQI
jgi:hypothetical protein